jgi:HAE1 family hydrophobic/amphiphilic exporter-1
MAMKGLTELSVKRGVTFSMIFLIIIGFGLFSLARLRLDMYPDITFPMIGVVTEYEGAGPREIEDLISRRIEGAVTAVEGVKEVSSTSKQGVSIVMVEFDWGTDLDQAEVDIRKHIDFIEGFLPEDAKDPIAFAFDPSMQPIVFMGLSGPYPEVKLREIAEDKVEPLLERLPGVASVDTVGGGKREIRVQLDPRRLGAAKVTPQQVVTALRMNNIQLPGGTFDQGGWQFNIQTKGRFTSVRQIETTVVGMRGTVPVRLRDVATVIDGLQEQTRLVRNNGRPGIMIMARKQSDANTVQAVREIMRALPTVERKAGRGIKLSVIFNQGEFIEKSIGNLSTTALYAFGFASLVLLFFLRSVRSSLIVAGAIPISVVATFSIMDAAGLTLNIISMAGLALAIGMLVDNSIVVLENIFTHNETGDGGSQAAIQGTKEVATAITASTLTTVVVFLPILFVPGIAGKMFGDMAITICFSLAASLFVARTGIPLAASRLLRGRSAGSEKGVIGRALAALTASYGRVLAWCLRNRKKTVGVVTVVFGLAMALGSQLEQEFFPKTDNSIITMQIDGIVGSSLEQTDAAFRRMEGIVERHVPEREVLNVDIGSGEGFVALFAKGPHSGIMRIKLKDRRLRSRSQQQIEEDLRKRFSGLPGITASAMGGNFFGSADVVVEISGYDLVQAREVGMKVKELVASVEGTRDVVFSLESGKPEYEVVLDRKRLAALGLNTAAVSSTISTFYAGTLASVYREGGHEYNIRVRGPRTMRRDQRDLHHLSIVTPTGASVPLASIAEVKPAVGPATIARKNQQRMVTVSCAVPGGKLGSVVKVLGQRLEAFPWPDEFNHHIGGQAEDFKESFMYLGLALLASILLVYMVMASQFESLLHPFLILFTIPLAMVGVVASLWLTGTSLSVTALIGILILVGLVVNNAIVLVDTINQYRLRREAALAASGGGDEVQAEAPYRASSHDPTPQQTMVDCVLEAGKRRLRPILMTALTTSLGMLPLAMELGEGAESWSPMARAVIGGLATSTLLTLIVIPALYTSLESFRIKRRAKKAAKRAARAAGQDASTA